MYASKRGKRNPDSRHAGGQAQPADATCRLRTTTSFRPVAGRLTKADCIRPTLAAAFPPCACLIEVKARRTRSL